ncbi:IclR family transcriptional regulator [Rhodococcus sp. D2-41]|uniref:IclR family transcriptional regulator n=1 Tax=Speluncibacter jeojiensis TaxID=2710754 RepID=A0A9X4M262_9ACTN|nr:IclR family transcriptional regulator [Rhodococcus sp. D2-41]MDG3008956.1 IclR family transcriptional regulator [Rhodococcus sp. D2-41]MDG3015467.1 IclR family transcriptional regulator [Corynebacteriales bacterium D3-21]
MTTPRHEPDGHPTQRASMLERMTDIIGLFEGAETRLQTGEIAAAAGLPRSTTHRIIDELLQLGWLVRTAGGYGLGPRMLIATRPESRLRLRAAAAPLLQVLHEETGVVAHLAIPDGTDVVIVDKIGGRVANTVPTWVGGRLPIHATALGKSILAWYTPEDVDDLLPVTLEKRTPNTISTRVGLHRELHEIRRRDGLAFGDEEAGAGVCCAAVSFECPDGTHAAIAVSARAARHHLERVGPLVRESARRISARLSDEGSPASGWTADDPARPGEDTMMIRLLSTIDGDDWV